MALDEGRGNGMLDQADPLVGFAPSVPVPGAGWVLTTDGLAFADLDQTLAHANFYLNVPNPLASCRGRDSKISEAGDAGLHMHCASFPQIPLT